ncbi:double-strand break repair helicase AddA [uncultured Litoreibacter sp.]|uniref:double-strand break repair helicase AddA n=1 Tax=uncultured Litoreibacter sp. TaxID=1392394 RepID=UPI00262BCEDE|nr:double-strand break repair helicase AddA [uncultured Litoreibacter sp.]
MTDDATRAQIDASLPNRSTWLSANAGSGKTRVLTDRVALLLLQGIMPQRILCLTYTKAAASEMQNRLFKRLGEWAMMPDETLKVSLMALGVSPGKINSEQLRNARRLFAKAIETPGGLKIQTIHSFCASLLRRFPLEAQVTPAFTEMDDRAAKLLRADVLDQMANDMPEVVQGLAQHFTGEDPDALLAEITRNAEAFAKPVSETELRALFALPVGTTSQTILDGVFNGDEARLIADMLPFLDAGGATDTKLAQGLRQLNLDAPDLSSVAALEPICLTGPKTKEPYSVKSTPPTKSVAADMGPLKDAFDALKSRVADAREARLALLSFQRTATLHAFATPFLSKLAAAKQQRGSLDFDDLIQKARQLLTNEYVASWVLFRLDGGIDHILVDEAQDTSPAQWDVIRLLAQEFTAGQGARTEQRTIFVVGDKKQSIYSFQGADPAEFDRMRRYFEEKLAAIEAPFASRELLYSFRSAAPILKLVDHVFTDTLRGGMGDALQHKAFKTELPGRVDLWDWIESGDKEEDKAWFDPVDTVGSDHHSVQLAELIARQIQHQILHGQITEIQRRDGRDEAITRPIRARDFLILVQSRSAQSGLFHEIIRACKTLGLPMAGADRLRVGGELGVRDLISLLSFLETPQDDLALAEIIRSPLGNLSEEDLYSLAHNRDGLLWTQLNARSAEFPDIHAMLDDLLNQADFMRPYDLLERALTYHHGRERLLSRLGVEAEEGIAALLDQALTYERSEAPTLTGFLTWLATDDVTIKRQMDSEGDFIRVMTVHGAKGLEAPIVILPQTGTTKNDVRDDILDAGGAAIWKARATEATRAQTDLTDAKKTLQQQERMRLLYVALTRAESWLIVCGSGDVPKKGDTWYEIVENGLTRAGAVPGLEDTKLRLAHLDWPADTTTRSPQAQEEPDPLPRWATEPLPAPVSTPAALSPSNLGGAKVLPGIPDTLSEEDAKTRGTAIHLLLEHLANAPKSERIRRAEMVLRGYDNPLGEDLLAVANKVLDAPHLQFLFDGSALAEVDVTATLPELEGRQINGAIDRLVITDDTVLAVDFKSNRHVPATPEQTPDGLLRQMGAYAAALGQIYPNRGIETAIVWTETAELMRLPHDIVSAALLCTTKP